MPQHSQPNPYELLGLSRAATPGDIQHAYRRAAQASHPDHIPEDPAAARRFAELTAAYETLRDPRRRAAYDRAHPQLTVRSSTSALPTWLPVAPARRPPLWAGPVRITPPRGG